MAQPFPFPTNFDGLQGLPAVVALQKAGASSQQVGDVNISGTVTAGNIVQSTAVQNNPANKGYQLLGRVVGLNINVLNQETTLFTTPASGFTRCCVMDIVLDNYSTAATTASLSFGGNAGTDNDWKTTATNANASTTNMTRYTAPATAIFYGTSATFATKTNTAQGGAATVDVSVWGYYV